MQQFQHYIGGKFSDGSAQFESRDPATGDVWAMMPEARADDVNAAVNAAYDAFFDPTWANMTASARGKLLYRLADLIAENAQVLAKLETRDTGKIIRETSAPIAYVAEYYRYYAGLADKIEGAHLPIDKPDMEVWLRREPLGVVAATEAVEAAPPGTCSRAARHDGRFFRVRSRALHRPGAPRGATAQGRGVCGWRGARRARHAYPRGRNVLSRRRA